MSETPKLKCSVCSAYLFEDDDIVYCPVCGAPHHRDCYNSVGHCALEDKHGTAEQYDFSKNSEAIKPDVSNAESTPKKKCQMCGTLYDADEVSCPNCNAPDSARFGRMSFQIDMLGGIPGDFDLGEGVKAEEAKQFAFVNTGRYIPKFAAMKLGKKSSFNLLAFLFPCGWFLSRKMYKIGAFVGVLEVALNALTLPFINALNVIMPESVNNYGEMVDFIAQNVKSIGKPATITAVIAIILNLALMIICGVLGDFFYRNHVVSTVKKLKSESEDLEEDFRKKGGVNIFLFLIGAFAVQYLPGILASFFL